MTVSAIRQLFTLIERLRLLKCYTACCTSQPAASPRLVVSFAASALHRFERRLHAVYRSCCEESGSVAFYCAPEVLPFLSLPVFALLSLPVFTLLSQRENQDLLLVSGSRC